MKISVIVPAYNAVPYLPRCLKSIFAQTLKPEEVIVVDDGSTDETAKLAAELGAKVVRRPNGGLSAARNTGIQAASCEWVALLDADDLWAPDKLERQAARVKPDTVLVYTGTRFFDDNGVREERPAPDPAVAKKLLQYCNPIPNTILVRREAVLKDGGYREDIRSCEDWEMLFRLQNVGTFEAIPDCLMDCYLHSDSLSANPQKMLLAMEQILDSTLLKSRHGLDRWAWRRRIWTAQLLSAGLTARDNKLKEEFSYLLRSLLMWPSPFWMPRRFLVFAVSAKNKLSGSRSMS